ncbi:MAG TPA: hypothetical protein VF104_07590, partial [Burkholderiales bacterium]
MSLLLEALKKAEKTKQEAPPAATPGAGPELSLEDESRPAERGIPLDSVELLAAADVRGAEQRAADQLFAAKSSPSRRGLIVAGSALLVALLAGAAYVWYEISVPKGGLVASGQRTTAEPPAAPAPAPAVSPSAASPAPAAPEKSPTPDQLAAAAPSSGGPATAPAPSSGA